MIEILQVSNELKIEARQMSEFRGHIKQYLSNLNANYDKFTVTKNDALLGYISETAVSNYLKENFSDRIELKSWSDLFDMNRIQNAIEYNNIKEIEYVKSFYYDKYDLEIIEKKSGKKILIDVKTAETCKEPNLSRNFLYPVTQNKKKGKDCVVLCYYCKATKDKENVITQRDRVKLAGYISEEEISHKRIIKAGSKTKFDTVSQIDNFETQIKDYKDLSTMLNFYFQ